MPQERAASRLLLAIGVAVTVSFLAVFLSSLFTPYVGVDVGIDNGAWRIKRIDENGTAYQAGLRPGDTVLEINGTSPESVAGGPDYVGVYRIQSVDVTALSGEVKHVSASGNLPAGAIAERIGYLIIGASFLSLGFVSFIRKRQSSAVTWLFLMSLSVASAPMLSLAAPHGWAELRPLEAINDMFAPWLVVRFFFEFPFEKRVRFRGRDATAIIFFLPVALLATYVSVGHSDAAFYSWFRTLILLNLVAGFSFSLITIFHSYLISHFGRSRQQIKILMGGVTTSLLPFIGLTVAPEALGLPAHIPPYVASLSLVILPFSIAHIFLKDKLLDIDWAVSRAFSYGLSLIPPVAGSVAMLWVISILQPRLDMGWRILGFAVLTAALAVSLDSVSGTARSQILARLTRGRYDYGRAATSVIAQVSSKTDLIDVSRTLASSLMQFLRLEGACVLLGDGHSDLIVSASQGVYSDSPSRQVQATVRGRTLAVEDQFPNKAPQEAGAAFFVPLLSAEKQIGMLVLGDRLGKSDFSADDVYFLLIIQSQASLAIANTMLLFEARKRTAELEAANLKMTEFSASLEQSGKALEQAYLNTIRTLVLALESRNPYTKQHSERVAALAHQIGEQMALSNEELRDLEVGGLIHDIGKIGVADSILLKPGPLEHHERTEVELHSLRGVEILRFLEFLGDSIPAIEYHHERYDGAGYPRGLHGEEIPLLARILAVADAFDAMTSDRPHRSACSGAEALQRLRDGAGSQWDPQVVHAFERLSIVRLSSL